MKTPKYEEVTLMSVAGGGQTVGTLASGKKIFVWGALPGERVRARITKNKSKYAEGVAEEIIKSSAERVLPRDPQSFLSTSPWQIYDFTAEQRYKAQSICDAFKLHGVVLPGDADVYTDGVEYGYRNKVEFSWWWDNETARLDLAFFRRGGHGKIPVDGTSLARPEINRLAIAIRDLLRAKDIEARSLKTLLIRCDRNGNCVWQLYTRDMIGDIMSDGEADSLPARGGEIIYSDPKSPASRITKRLMKFGTVLLSDSILGSPYNYAAESFFQVNIPVYEQALRDMKSWIMDKPTVDLYSGVGSIGLTIGSEAVSLVEIDEHAYRELTNNVALQRRDKSARAMLAPAEKALDYITSDATIIVDPPRAGLHEAVTERLLTELPPRIVYLSCNPVTQARDTERLLKSYDIVSHRGYNFFPRTPHIEHLVVLDKR